jgi:hypothetical protein
METFDRLTPHEIRAVAVRASVDPRTAARFLAGLPTHSTTADRIATALRELGVEGAKDRQPPTAAGPA